MNFRSDNEVGAHPSIIAAVSRAFTSGSAFSYGADDWTQRVESRLHRARWYLLIRTYVRLTLRGRRRS